MGNPRPTRSKPCKIGRKHTGAPGLRELGRIASRKAKNYKESLARWRLYKKHVHEWWLNLREDFPTKPTK